MEKIKTASVSVQTTVDVSIDSIQNLLCSAFEGGSNYWYQIDTYVKPTKLTHRSDKKTVFRHLDYPVNGGALVILDTLEDNKPYILNMRAIRKGIRVMANDYPRHFAAAVSDSGDAITGDVFLQCCLFSKVIYG